MDLADVFDSLSAQFAHELFHGYVLSAQVAPGDDAVMDEADAAGRNQPAHRLEKIAHAVHHDGPPDDGRYQHQAVYD
ncbi:hypothetical protein D3C78_1608600 [compost metagenome]